MASIVVFMCHKALRWWFIIVLCAIVVVFLSFSQIIDNNDSVEVRVDADALQEAEFFAITITHIDQGGTYVPLARELGEQLFLVHLHGQVMLVACIAVSSDIIA